MIRKKIIIILIFVSIIFISTICHTSSNNIINDLYKYPVSKNNIYKKYIYDLYADNVNIIGYTGVDSKIEIPTFIEGKPVLSIEDSVFYGNDYIEKVIISNTVIKIGYQAFIGCANLKEIYIPKSVIYIGKSAFDNCPNLKDIYIKKHSKQEYLLKDMKYEKYIKYK